MSIGFDRIVRISTLLDDAADFATLKVYFADTYAYLPQNSVKLSLWTENNRLIMSEQFVDRTVDDVCSELCAVLDGDALVLNPSRRMFQALVNWGAEHPETFSRMRLLGDRATLKDALTEFTIASRTAELVENDLLELRSHHDPPKSSIAIDDTTMLVIIDVGDAVGALSTSDAPLVSNLFATSNDRFEEAEDFLLHTPALSRIETTLIERLGDDRWEDFIQSVEAVSPNSPVDEVIISILVAAKHRDLLYDISKWGEDIGLASKATFSRKKAELEECALIDTDSEPIDVGRPRLRLRLAEPALEAASPAEIIAEAERRLS